MSLTYFDVVQPSVEDVETNDSTGHTPEVHLISALVTFTPNIAEIQSHSLDATILLRPIVGRIVEGVLCSLDDTPGVELLANTTDLELDGDLLYHVEYSKVRFDKGDRTLRGFWITALTGAGTVDLNTVDRIDESAYAPAITVSRIPDAVRVDGNGKVVFSHNGIDIPGPLSLSVASDFNTVHAAGNKVTPIDADELALSDSAGSWVLRRLSFANLKAALKTYFDSVATTFTNKTLTNPKIGQINDTNGNAMLYMLASTSAVNYLFMQNAATTGYPMIRATGSDNDVSLGFRPKGTGMFRFQDVAGTEAFQVVPAASAVNYMRLDSSAAGVTLPFRAVGSDADISINVIPKGAGVVQANGVPVSINTTAQAHTAKVYIAAKTSTATASGTTTLDITSSQVQVFTGTLAQTVKLPTTSVVQGQTYTVINKSSGAVAVQSSGANAIVTLGAACTYVFMAITDTPTAAADWIFFSTSGSYGATAYSTALRDYGGVLLASRFLPSFTSTATAGATTTLSLNSNEIQQFTGTLAQTCQMASASVIPGHRITIINNSTQSVIVTASAGATITTLTAGTAGTFVALTSTPTLPAHWQKV